MNNWMNRWSMDPQCEVNFLEGGGLMSLSLFCVIWKLQTSSFATPKTLRLCRIFKKWLGFKTMAALEANTNLILIKDLFRDACGDLLHADANGSPATLWSECQKVRDSMLEPQLRQMTPRRLTAYTGCQCISGCWGAADTSSQNCFFVIGCEAVGSGSVLSPRISAICATLTKRA